ncbi:MAG: dihydropteroate synthase [Desulfatibacillaceae bacterium]
MKHYAMAWKGRRLLFGGRTLLMGIVNVTPDSFSDGGEFAETDAAVARGVRLVRDGADILDVGGESTRPGADAVSVDEEMRRVIPVIEELARQVSVPVSVDTSKASVAERALEAGASMINDVTALRGDPRMGEVAARAGVPVILMHMLGTPRTMQEDPRYDDVVRDVRDFLAGAVDRAVAAGVDRGLIMADPGIGFGKTLEHNLALIRRLGELESLDVPILLGHSRKAFIRKQLAKVAEGREADMDQVIDGTVGVAAAAAAAGVHVIRVHDVARVRPAVVMADALRRVEAERS